MNQQNIPVIFLAFANDRMDSAQYLRNLPVEQRGIRNALVSAQQAGLCKVVERTNTTIDDIFDVFQEYGGRISIFHYGGHAHCYQLLLESDEGERSVAHSGGLVSFLAGQNSLKLVFLNGCSSQQQAEDLTKAGVPLVIGTSQAINDDIATDFSIRFYKGLAAGLSFYKTWLDSVDSVKMQKGESNYRDLYARGKKEPEERFPWDLYIRPGSEMLKEWNLPDESDNPLFGLPSVPPAYPLPDDPYLFLRWYDRKHAEVFWGRSRYIRLLYEKVTYQKMPPVVLLFGKSGSGKSSLLEAGFLPRIEESHAVVYKRRSQSRGLLFSLSDALHTLIEEYGILNDSNNILELWLSIEHHAQKPLVVLMDQVEEAYTRGNDELSDEIEDFFHSLSRIFDGTARQPGGKVILGYRKEFHPEIMKQCEQNGLFKSKVFLEQMEFQDIEEVVWGITRTEELRSRYHLTVQQELPALIAADLLCDKNAPVAPALQIILTKMWNMVRMSNTPCFTIDLYQNLRQDGIAMSDFFRQQMTTLSDWNENAVNTGLALDILYNHTTRLGSAGSLKSEILEKYYRTRGSLIEPLITQLKDLYLLSYSGSEEGETRLAHDTLAPIIIKKYTYSAKPGQRARRLLDAKMVDFSKRKSNVWLDPADLETVEKGLAGTKDLTESEQTMVTLSRKKRDALKMIKRVVIGALALGLIGIIFSSVLSFRMWIKSTNSLIAMYNSRAEQALADKRYEDAIIYYYKLLNMKTPLRPEMNINIMEVKDKIIPELYSINGHTKMISKLIYSPDGTHIVSAGYDNTIKIWETTSGVLIKLLNGHTQGITSVGYAPDGSYLISASLDGTLKVWDPGTGKEIRTLTGHDGPVTAVEISPGGAYIASGSADSTIIIWNAATWTQKAKFNAHTYGVSALAFSAERPILASGGKWDETIKIWDIRTGKRIAYLLGHREAVRDLKFFKNTYLASGSSDSTIMIWDCDNYTLLESFVGHDATVLSISLSHDEKKLISGSSDNTIIVWDIETGIKSVTLKGHTNDVSSVALSPDSSFMVSGSSTGRLKLWDFSSKEDPITSFSGHSISTNSVIISRDFTKLAIGRWDGMLTIIDFTFGTHRMLPGHADEIYAVTFSKDAALIATGDKTGSIILWDQKSGQKVKTMKGHTETVNALVFSEDKYLLASAGDDKKVILWDTITGLKKNTFSWDGGKAYTAAISPDTTLVAAGYNDGTVILWDSETGKKNRRLKSHNDSIFSLAFSPDGKICASASVDRNIVLFEVPSGKKKHILSGHNDVINSIRFSQDGRYLISAGEDNMVVIWNAASGRMIKTLKGFKGAVTYASFNIDMTKVYSICYDGNVFEQKTGFEYNKKMLRDLVADYISFGISYYISDEGKIVYRDDENYVKHIGKRFGDYAELLEEKYRKAEEGTISFMPEGGKKYTEMLKDEYESRLPKNLRKKISPIKNTLNRIFQEKEQKGPEVLPEEGILKEQLIPEKPTGEEEIKRRKPARAVRQNRNKLENRDIKEQKEQENQQKRPKIRDEGQ